MRRWMRHAPGATQRRAGLLIGCVMLARAAGAQQDILDEAAALQRQLQYAESTRLLAEAFPGLRDERRARAALLLAAASADHKEARRWLREAQQAAPGGDWQRRADLELARLDFARGNYNSVRSRLAAHDDDESRALVASSWVALNNAGEAEAVLRDLPVTPRTQLLRCWAMRARGDTAAALAALAPLAEASSDFQPTALLWKSECEMALGRAPDAATTAAALQRRYPHSPEIVLLEPVLHALRQTPRAPTAPETSAVLVQLGVFETRANALRLRDTVPTDLGPARVDEVHQGNRRLYRVSLGPFESAALATNFGRTRLAPRGFEWRLVTPESP